jgi:hypothetical protein
MTRKLCEVEDAELCMKRLLRVVCRSPALYTMSSAQKVPHSLGNVLVERTPYAGDRAVAEIELIEPVFKCVENDQLCIEVINILSCENIAFVYMCKRRLIIQCKRHLPSPKKSFLDT